MLLELKNVVKQYEAPSEKKSVEVLHDVCLKVDSRETIAIVGPSGSGKSTLLNIAGALDKPSSGSVIFNGTNLSSLSDAELATIRNQEIGFVFQLHHLLPQCTVFENILIPTIPQKNKTRYENIQERAEKLLKIVGLDRHMEYFPGQLSGGERQRVAVVRALINQPQLLLADEPTGSLDQISADHLGQLLVELNRDENVALIVVTHSIQIAQRMSRIYELKNGTLQQL